VLPKFSFRRTGPLIIDFAPNEVSFHETRFTGPNTNVTVGGTIATARAAVKTWTVSGDVNLRIFSGLSPDVFSSGVARLFLRCHVAAMTIRDVLGTAEVAGASVSVFSGDQTITVANSTASFGLVQTRRRSSGCKERLAEAK
jgi:hypothetical protein